jgi:hypothetical protein
VVSVAWSFGADGTCTASAAGPAAAFSLAVDPARMTLAVSGFPFAMGAGGAAVPVAYSGSSGSWVLNGRPSGRHQVIVAEPMTEVEASRILFLLDGGTIRLGRTGGDTLTLRVPEAGAAGQAWFGCVRKVLLP